MEGSWHSPVSPNSDDCELATEYVCSLLSGEDGIAKVQGPAGASCGRWKLPDAPSVFLQGYSPQPPTQEERIIFGGRI